MSTARPIHLSRRLLLGTPALIVAAVTTLVAKPAQAGAKPKKVYECAADLLQES